MSGYFLIARKEEDNQVEVLSLDQQWYLGRQVPSLLRRKNPLEAIDLVTTRFPSKEEMIQQMYQNGYISSPDVDLFIASKKRGANEIRQYEILYNPVQSERMEQLRKIALASYYENISLERGNILLIFDEVIKRAHRSMSFQKLLLFEENIPSKFSSFIQDDDFTDSIQYEAKYQEAWYLRNYALTRNLVESLNRMDLFYQKEEEKREDLLQTKRENRKRIEPQLLKLLDRDYIAGQYHLFDYLNEKSAQEEEKAPTEIKEEIPVAALLEVDSEETEVEKVSLNNDFSTPEQMEIVMEVFGDLPMGVITEDCQTYSFNPSVFSFYYSSVSATKLRTLLKGKLPKYLFQYSVHNDKYREAQRNGANTNLLEQDLWADTKKIANYLEKPSVLASAFEWCQVYMECSMENKLYGESQIAIQDGGQNDGPRYR